MLTLLVLLELVFAVLLLVLLITVTHSLTHTHHVKFTAGEPLEGVQHIKWNNPHSGSVFTSKVGGRSLYGRITKFVQVLCKVKRQHQQFALVEWFAPPTYPDGDPLLVQIRLDSPPLPQCPSFLCLDKIDTTSVMYELHDTHIFMMRIRGLDTYK